MRTMGPYWDHEDHEELKEEVVALRQSKGVGG